MVTEHPGQEQISGLRQLWKLAFGDTDTFLDIFFDRAFSLDRCLCTWEADTVLAALYWFDCEVWGRKIAYLYAVATHPAYRGRGLCHRLMESVHEILGARDYAGVILVPQEENLRKFYGGMGYRDCGGVAEQFCTAAETAVSIRQVDAVTYGILRRTLLPQGGVCQEGENLRFLEATAKLYAGEDFLLAASEQDGALWAMELLGNTEAAPGILRALDYDAGTFRMMGTAQPFGMFLPLTQDIRMPEYFGHAYD